MRALVLIFSILFITYHGNCQIKEDRSEYVFLSAKLGGAIGLGNEHTGVVSGCEFGRVKNKEIISVMYLFNDEFFGRNGFLNEPAPERLHQFDLLWGKVVKVESIELYYQAGLGLMHGTIYNPEQDDSNEKIYRSKRINSIGIPLKAGFNFFPESRVDFTLEALGNINLKRNLFGIALTLNFRDFK